MTSIPDFLARLAAQDVKLWLVGDKLRCSGPEQVMTAELHAALAAAKPEIVSLLSCERVTDKPLFEPQSESFAQDPYAALAQLRQRDPVHKTAHAHWLITRYGDVLQALDTPALGNEPASYAQVRQSNRPHSLVADVAGQILPFMEGPRHVASRRLIARAFQAHLRQSAPDIRAMAQRLLRQMRQAGQGDIVADFAAPLSVEVICTLLGVPAADWPMCAVWSDSFLHLLAGITSAQVYEDVERSAVGFRAYWSALMRERRAHPGNDLLTALLDASDGVHRLSDTEIADTCMLLLADGSDNVGFAIANSVHALFRHPAQLERLRSEPGLMRSAVDELLRFESPVQFIARVATQDIEFAGKTIRRNDAVLLALGAANRDSAQFAAPDVLDIAREPNAHLAFGRGRHACLGSALVRMELGAALEAVLQELPAMRLRDERVRWRVRPGHRWLESLPVTYAEPATATI